MVLKMFHCGRSGPDSRQGVNDKISGHVFVCPFVCHFTYDSLDFVAILSLPFMCLSAVQIND